MEYSIRPGCVRQLDRQHEQAEARGRDDTAIAKRAARVSRSMTRRSGSPLPWTPINPTVNYRAVAVIRKKNGVGAKKVAMERQRILKRVMETRRRYTAACHTLIKSTPELIHFYFFLWPPNDFRRLIPSLSARPLIIRPFSATTAAAAAFRPQTAAKLRTAVRTGSARNPYPDGAGAGRAAPPDGKRHPKRETPVINSIFYTNPVSGSGRVGAGGRGIARQAPRPVGTPRDPAPGHRPRTAHRALPR